MNEIWKSIPGYEGLYEASDFGRIRSLGRMKWNGQKEYFYPGRILKPGTDLAGYKFYFLCKNGEKKIRRGHRLVLTTFQGISNKLSDHINHIRSDNRLNNLRYVTCRENSQNMSRKSKTGFIGVYKSGRKFMATIKINGKNKYLGTYETPEYAHQRYLKAVSELDDGK